MALKDVGSATALGGGVGRRLIIAVAALGGGGGRRTCDDGVGVDVGVGILKATGLLLWRLARTVREDVSDAREVCQGDGKEIGVLRRRWRLCRCKDGAGKARARGQWHGARPAQVRRGQCKDGFTKKVTEESKNG